MIEYVLFDAANTLIHKPSLWSKMDEVLKKHNINIDTKELREKHKLVSELVKFPDVTSESFYKRFNTELLNSLGLVESEELLLDIYNNCKYLPWESFEDAKVLSKLSCKIGVLSNFSSKLRIELKALLPNVNFDHIIISEEKNVSKPNLEIFKIAIEEIGLEPEKILYIGDSLKLDIKPAIQLGMKAALIDRDGVYMYSKYRIDSLKKIILS